MRHLAAFALAIFTSAATAAEYQARDTDGNSVRLTEIDCAASVLVHVPDEWKGRMQAAWVVLRGQNIIACWASRDDGKVIVQLDDGRVLVVPMPMFRLVPGA